MSERHKKLLNGNKIWALSRLQEDPAFFRKNENTQTPQYLWIGCSDSRVPANAVTNTSAGDIFVHRNIANLVVADDLNLLSVVAYAVQYLKVKHIIVCGHYGCGGVKAAMDNKPYGFVDKWLKNIKDVYAKHAEELNAIEDIDSRTNRLVDLNVIEQVHNLSQTELVKEAVEKGELHLHGWVYGLNNGIITDLDMAVAERARQQEVYLQVS